MTTSAAHGTLYDDWLARRARLREYHGDREPIVAVQVRVLDYLIDRYRDEAAALEAAPPTLEAMYVNHRAIIINHHRWQGVAEGVKSRGEANERVSRVVARMQRDPVAPADADWEPPKVAKAAPETLAPSDPDLRRIWKSVDRAARAGEYISRPQVHHLLAAHPYLPDALVGRLIQRMFPLGGNVYEDHIAFLERCQNARAPEGIFRAWRERLGLDQEYDIRTRLRRALVIFGSRVVALVRSLLAGPDADARLEAYSLLAEIGELRDIGLLSDLLRMPRMSDEHPDERAAIAGAMESIATRYTS